MSTEQLAAAINQRIAKMGMSKTEVARRAHVSPSLLHKTLGGQHKMSEDSARKLDVALGWPTGTLLAILEHGADPPVDLLSDPDRLQHLESEFAELRRDVVELTAAVQSLVDDVRQRTHGSA